MAARLTDRQKDKIIADYVDLGSISAAARVNNVSRQTVKRTVEQDPALCRQLQQKRSADILEYMDRRRELVCEILDKGLDALNSPDKLSKATPAQITSALATLLDKWLALGPPAEQDLSEDALSRSLRELAQELVSDD